MTLAAEASRQGTADAVVPATPSALVTPEEYFVAQCESDYIHAEITAVAHVASGSPSTLTHVLAVVELLHEHMEPNPLIGLVSASGGYPRRRSLGLRGGTLLVQRWRCSVRDGIQWYRACKEGSMSVPGKNASEPTIVPLHPLEDDPPWPHAVVEVEKFWDYSEFWGDRPGGSRWHRLVPLAPVAITSGWQASDFEKAHSFFMSEIHVDLMSRSVLLGSCHLRLPNPVYRALHQRAGRDRRSIIVELELHPNKSPDGLELILSNQRPWGATSVQRIKLQPGVNELCVPEGHATMTHAVTCSKRGLLKQSGPLMFISSVSTSMSLVSEQRRVIAPRSRYTVDVVKHSQSIQVGTPQSVSALIRLAADEGQQRTQKTWAATAFQWFDNDGLSGTQAIRDIIQSAKESVDLLDPYFGYRDLLEFAPATTKRELPFRVLTSADFCSGDDPGLMIERGDALASTLDSLRSQDPGLNIEVKVMPGQKSPVHDRLLIVDGTVWVLGASLNEFGSRGSLLMKLPASPEHSDSGTPAFSVSTSVFDAHWTTSDTLPEWVQRRAASRTGSRCSSRPVSLQERVRSTKAVLDEALRRLREVWRA